MKIKKIVLTGVVLSLFGLALCIFAACRSDFDLTEDYTKQEATYGKISKIIFDGSTDNVIISKSSTENNICYYVSETLSYQVKYDSLTETLYINEKDKFVIINSNFKVERTFKINLTEDLELLNVDLDTGNIEIKDTNISKANFNIDAGNINLINVSIDNIYCDLDAGNLKLSNSNLKKLELDLDAGNYESNDTIIASILADIDVGKFKHNGSITNTANINVDVGDISLELYQEQSEFCINGNGLGTINIIYEVNIGKFDIDYFK